MKDNQKEDKNKEEEKPRGYYKEVEHWSRDREEAYYDGFEIEFFWPFVKISTILIVYLVLYKIINLNMIVSIIICVLITAFY